MLDDALRGRTLQEIDGEDWGEPQYPSRLVVNCHRLRHVPLRDFTVEDLRLMIGQDIGREYLVPLALEKLWEDPFAGEMYDGDLLNAVRGVPASFWAEHPIREKEWLKILNTLLLYSSEYWAQYPEREKELLKVLDSVTHPKK